MTHHHLAFERTYSFKRNAYYDQQCCTAKADALQAGYEHRNDDGEYGDDSEEYRTDQCYLVEGVVNKVGSGLTGSVTGDSTVVLLEVICDLNRIVLNGNVEIVERDDQHEVDNSVKNTVLAEQSYKTIPEGISCTIDTEEVADGLREAHEGHREDDGHYACHRNLDRDVSGLTAIHLSADNTLSVLNRNSTLKMKSW